MKKLALKRLTASDLTFFHWHYLHRRAGNQKAINLNSGIFVDQLYPAFPDAVRSLGGRAPLDMYLFGPGLAGPHNLQRKILRQQKNWRLNGEFVNNPDDAPERYNPLEPGDILVIEFSGDVVPTSAKLVFLAATLPEDRSLQAAFDAELGTASMMTIGLTRIEEIVDQVAAPPDHPINELLLDEAIEDAVRGGYEGTRRLLSRPSGRQLTRENLLRSRRNADDIGRMGEELVNAHLEGLRSRGEISVCEWTADVNAISPYDFSYDDAIGTVLLDVKSTSGEFDRTIHVSLNELIQMAQEDQRFDIYRVYNVSETSGRLRIAENVGDFARGILQALRSLPAGILADGISFHPRLLQFGAETHLEYHDEEGGEDALPVDQ